MAKSTDSNDDKKSDKSVKPAEQEHAPGMRVGEEYQAEVPDILKDVHPGKDSRPEPLLVWAPCDRVSDVKMDDYLKVAKDKFGYNMEQALGMLYWHRYEVDKAMDDLKNFTPLPDEWSMEDKVIFEQSFGSYGKSFPRIRQQLPDKSVGTLVKYYYAWKKNRNKKSLMDKGERSIITGIFADDSNGDNDSSDSDYEPADKKPKSAKNGIDKPLGSVGNESKPSPMLSTNCVNCAGVTPQMNSTPRGKMCVPCYDYWRRTGKLRLNKDSIIPLYLGQPEKRKGKPPKGMHLNQESLIDVAQARGDSHVRPLEMDLLNLRRQITSNRQMVQDQKHNLDGKANIYRPSELNQKLNPRWTNEELLIAVQCVRRYGKDFQAMTEVLGNKNIAQCRNFFLNYRRRFNLMDVLAEYEKENNIPRSESCMNDNWEENADIEMDSAIYPTSSIDASGPGTADSEASQPPPLRRQTENTPVHDALHSQGPPPLVNNAVNPIISTAS